MNILIENQSFPIVSWYKYSFEHKHIYLFSCEPYRKMSFRNRYVISGSNGLIHLSVPLENGRDQKTKFKDVRISDTSDWQLVHWRTLTSCYNTSPFFLYYADKLAVFFSGKWKFLFEWNLSILHWLQEVLDHPAEIKVVEEMDSDDISMYADFRNKWLPKNFQETPNGIIYPQVFEERIGFQTNLSILDLIFNTGPMAREILKNSLTQNQKE